MSTFENILVETRGRVGLVTLNRPKQLNALNDALMEELGAALKAFDADDAIGAVVLTGSAKAFAAGADIGAMAKWSYMEVYKSDYITRNWETLCSVRKPVIAAVGGFALGGGCELAMACDIRIASEKAKFGQPETGLGITPGFGGTQRLPRLVGKGRAKELLFTADMIDAAEAYRIGLVNKVVPPEELMEAAKALAGRIMKRSAAAVQLAKAAVNRGIEAGLENGIAYEAEVFGLCFATEDQKEGMTAFVEKRKPEFKNR